MGPDQVPGQVIGSVGAREVNATTAWLDQLVTKHDLPQKLLLIHQFTDDMIPEAELKERGPGLRAQRRRLRHPDAEGRQVQELRRSGQALPPGFKLFYSEDVDTTTPAEVMRLSPRPDVVVYE